MSYVDSLITINDKYEQFDPFQMFKSTDMRKIRQTATKNISRFYDLYKYYSDTSPNDYQYAIFRKIWLTIFIWQVFVEEALFLKSEI